MSSTARDIADELAVIGVELAAIRQLVDELRARAVLLAEALDEAQADATAAARIDELAAERDPATDELAAELVP